MRTCLQRLNDFICYTCAPNPKSLKAHLIVMSENNLHVSDQSCFDITNAIPSRPLIIRMTQRLFSRLAKSFGCPPLCLSILPPTSFFGCVTKEWITSTKVSTLRVKTPLLSCAKAWCFYSWDNTGIWLQTILQIVPYVLWNQGYEMHKKSHDVLKYAMHIQMSMLEEWWWTKMSNLTLTTSTILILETLNSFHFLVSHLCNWLLELLLWSLHQFNF